MYRTKHFRWKLAHTSGILAHLGLAVAASISYTYHIGQATGPIQWSYPAHQIWTSMSLNPCGSVLMGDLEGGYILDTAARRTLLTCIAVGSLGFALNTALFILLLAVEPNRITLTEGEQHWRKQIVTFFGCMLNLLLAGAGLSLASSLGMKTAGSKSLTAPLIWASIQTPLALFMAVLDAVKNYREGLDLLD